MRATEGLKIGCGGMGSRWLSRFKLIRLRRISLATLRRDGWMGGFKEWAGLRNGQMGGWVGLRNGLMGGFKEWVDGWV